MKVTQKLSIVVLFFNILSILQAGDLSSVGKSKKIMKSPETLANLEEKRKNALVRVIASGQVDPLRITRIKEQDRKSMQREIPLFPDRVILKHPGKKPH